MFYAASVSSPDGGRGRFGEIRILSLSKSVEGIREWEDGVAASWLRNFVNKSQF
jgi:hypothetical protein